jgi:hypothetical protein
VRLAATVLLLSLPLFGRTYATRFQGTENPIFEKGAWANGATAGLDWCNVRSTTGLASGVGPCPTEYADPSAVLTGQWGPDQSVQATAHIVSPDSSYYQEIELHLRRTISPHKATGYEINFGVSHSYLQIVRWNGALADFTYLGSTCDYPAVCGQVNGFRIRNGDVAKATIKGNKIEVYVNGVLIAATTDDTFTSGSPGIGFNYGCGSSYLNHGWSSFSATDEAH